MLLISMLYKYLETNKYLITIYVKLAFYMKAKT